MAETMRRILNHAKKKKETKRGGEEKMEDGSPKRIGEDKKISSDARVYWTTSKYLDIR